MGVMEIVLIIVGGIILILSYVLPAGKKDSMAEHPPKIDEQLIKELIEKEIEKASSHISDVVDETITYSIEKTERAMERLSNEKIMAVNEYSDLVLEAIHKNHQEVIFLYDMLNDKHENLVNTVSEASQKAKEIKQTVQDAEITVKEVSELLAEETVETEKTEQTEQTEEESGEEKFIPISPKKVEVINGVIQEECESSNGEAEEEIPVEEVQPDEEKSYNNNEKILRLHKIGKSKTAIAKELGLGVGEVKLVIDLFEQA